MTIYIARTITEKRGKRHDFVLRAFHQQKDALQHCESVSPEPLTWSHPDAHLVLSGWVEVTKISHRFYAVEETQLT